MPSVEQEPWYRRELTGRKLVWHLCWQALHWGVFAYGWYSPHAGLAYSNRYSQVSDQKLALLNTLKFSVWSSRGAGLVLAMDGFLIMLAVCRNLIRWLRPKIRFLPLDENLWFHRQTAYMLLLFSIIHTTAHYVNFFVLQHCMVLTVERWSSPCSTCYRFTNPLCRCRGNYRSCHASVYAPHVHYGPYTYPKTILRSVLVYSPSRLHFCVGVVYSCHWMLRSRYNRALQSIVGWDVLDTLHWIRRMESNHHQRRIILLRKSMASYQQSTRHQNHQSRYAPSRYFHL
jgi:hypothetical protein